MESILRSAGNHLKSPNDDDVIDRLSHVYCVRILVIFALLVTARQYVGDPIRCWCPNEFSGEKIQYVNHICWVTGTYYIPLDQEIPSNLDTRKEKKLSYYQWVPSILLIEALLFYIPRMVWRLGNGRTGIDVNRVVSLAIDAQYDAAENRQKVRRYLVYHLDRCLDSHNQQPTTCCHRLHYFLSAKMSLFCGKRHGNVLFGLYILVKLLYIVNAIGQLYMLNVFLKTDFTVYGLEVIRNAIYGSNVSTSPRFPLVTLCDFDIRQLSNLHKTTVQCVLSINLFNDKIFIFLWFLLVFVFTVTLLNMIQWLWRSLCPANRVNFIKKLLKIMGRVRKTGSVDKKLAYYFTHDYLRHDGVLILRLISINSNDIVVAEIVSGLWDIYKSKKVAHKYANNDPSTEGSEIYRIGDANPV